MKELPSYEFEQLINNIAYESRHLEFKSGFDWSDNQFLWLKEKVAKTIISLSNTKGGGKIIIGIREKNKNLVFMGVNDRQLQSFQNYDSIKLFVDEYIFLNTNFEVYKSTYQNKNYVVIKVDEFSEYPLITVRDGIAKKANGRDANIIKRDRIYVRSRDGIQVTTLSYQEIIEVINLSAERINAKQLKNYKDFCECGMKVESISEKQENILNSAKNIKTADKIKSKGYWQIFISPDTNSGSEFIKNSNLKNLFLQTQIGYGDEFYPVILKDKTKGNQLLGLSNNFINYSDYSYYKEFLSLNNMGEILYLKACKNDWLDEYFAFNKLKVNTKQLKSIYLAEIVTTITLTYLYIHNFVTYISNLDNYHFKISLINSLDRVLLINNSETVLNLKANKDILTPPTFLINAYDTREILLAKSIETIKALLKEFNFDVNDDNIDQIKNIQNRLLTQ